uniref:Uncharacterized protein n=1 Tax=Oryza nivara TaxID=4536 RepID=A0A0E0IYW4_ORYNI
MELPLWLPDQALFTVLLMTLPMVFSTMGRVQAEVVVASKVRVGGVQVDTKAHMGTVMGRRQTEVVVAGKVGVRTIEVDMEPQADMKTILILRRTLVPLITVYLTLAIIYHALKMDWPPFENK